MARVKFVLPLTNILLLLDTSLRMRILVPLLLALIMCLLVRFLYLLSILTLFTLSPITTSFVLGALQTNPLARTIWMLFFSLHLSAPLIAAVIPHFNLSILTGVVTSLEDCSSVLPLHKGGDKCDPNNYQAISRLSCLAKMLESLVNGQLKGFLTIYSVFSPHQSGFRANHSTTSAITLVTNNIA